jgi:dTMP kinase
MLEQLRNKFIVAEGYENTGKTTVMKLLVDSLNANSVDAIFTFQPGDSNWGALAPTFRSLCKDKRWDISPMANLFAFLFDRAECVDKVIRPALKAGKTVVCDRYTYSTVAYQLFGKQIYKDLEASCGKEQAGALYQWFKNPYTDVFPDYVFYFPERVGNRKDDANDLFDNEKSDFEKRVRDAYHTLLVNETNWIEIHPGQNAEETLSELVDVIRTKIQ